MTKVSVKTGDTVLVNSGKDSGKKGKVLAVRNVKGHTRVLVENVNLVTKAKRARTAQEKSELVKQEAPIDISNVNVICPSCGKAIRVRHAVVEGKKVRTCSKCDAVLDAKFVKAKKASTKEDKKAEKAAKTEKKSRATKASAEKATKTAVAKKPTTTRSSQRGV